MTEAKWCYQTQSWRLSLCSGEQWNGEKIWLATGCKLNVNQDPLLGDVMRKFPIQVRMDLELYAYILKYKLYMNPHAACYLLN